ncbi:hypothetical protein ANN_10539 [Periplaneta americana]|uniref:Uncharacterized protein n=1 Tax=Periplaneta americana TaxID=6978 RepID=A0ABQ8TQW4_PERAM|nr:hypothetical protein ANN_10539 [Periplaneta americana]
MKLMKTLSEKIATPSVSTGRIAISGLLAEVDLQREILAKRAEEQISSESDRKLLVQCISSSGVNYCLHLSWHTLNEVFGHLFASFTPFIVKDLWEEISCSNFLPKMSHRCSVWLRASERAVSYEVIVNVCWEWSGIDIGNGEVKEVYGMGQGKNRPILVRLANRMIKEKIMDSKKALKNSSISIDEDFAYEMRCRRNVLVPFMKAARKNGHYAKLIKDKLKINGELFDVEFCLENLNASTKGENIDERKRIEIKERVREIVSNSGMKRKGKVAEGKRTVTQEIAIEGCHQIPFRRRTQRQRLHHQVEQQ